MANEVETEQIVTTVMEEANDVANNDVAKITESKTNSTIDGTYYNVDTDQKPFPCKSRPLPPSYTYRSSSLVQVRGSIPLYWHHINLLSPAPDIVIESMPYADFDKCGGMKEDEGKLYSYPASRWHMKRLYERYGGHVDILNLVKLRHSKREQTIGRAYVDLCNTLAPSLDLKFEGRT